MNSSDDISALTSTAAYPSLAADQEVSSLQEVSHVFHCMQCDLQFQMDMAYHQILYPTTTQTI